MNFCKSKVGIGIDIEVISSTELQWQKIRRLFSFLPTPSAYDSVDYLLLESQESVAEKLTTML